MYLKKNIISLVSHEIFFNMSFQYVLNGLLISIGEGDSTSYSLKKSISALLTSGFLGTTVRKKET